MSGAELQAPVASRGRLALTLLLCALLAPLLAALLLPSMAQPQAYHDFADQRTFFGVPNAFNVLSNVPFLLVGALGLALLWRRSMTTPPADRPPWVTLFIGVALTAFGSSWYHLNPNDATLVWDRLPMALGFAGLVAGTLIDRLPRWHAMTLGALALVGTGSVLGWSASGNLMPYLAMQAGFIVVALAATALVPTPYTHAAWLYWGAALYAAAMVAERLDRPIDALLGSVVSGHTLKHLLAAAGIYVIYRMLRERRRLVGTIEN
jgi:predicted membrane channel-forming protein YqfA (hemolysin III family)